MTTMHTVTYFYRINVHVIAITLLTAFSGCSTQTPSPFWSSASKSLKLYEARSNARAPKKPPNVNRAITSLPEFMPLCGNGRIDTKEDYIAYYKNTSHLPLSLTKQQILYMYKDLPDPAALHSVSFLADEECDDGNRVDFDGCSADCMYLDLWTSPCEMAVDLNLEYEDLIYDTVRRSMVVSAKTGIYTLDVGLNSTSLIARLIAGKAFTVTDIFRNSTSLILYSAEQQALFQMVDGTSSITFLNEIQHLAKWNPSQIIRHIHQNSDGSVVAYDAENMVYLATLTSTAYSACNFGRRISACTFSQYQSSGAVLFICDHIRVEIGPGTCNIFTSQAIPSDGSIWRDVLTKISYETFTLQIKLASSFSVSPPTTPSPPPELSFEMYHPMGGFLEVAMGNARRFGDLSTNPGILYYTGDSTLLDMIVPVDLQEESKTCGPDRCIFDIDRGYDIFDQNPLKNAFGKSWNDFLQEKISQEAETAPVLNNLAAIKADAQRYDRLLDSFAAIFRSTVTPLIALAIQKHPVTRNTWALRKDKLIEISKSGVQLKRADGKCIPSGVALCGDCQWAPNGHKCRPCSVMDTNSWSWNMKCRSCVKESSRRLLTEESYHNITFVLAGNLTRIFSSWPNAVKDPVTSLATVSIVTKDSVTDMQQIQLQLLEMTDVQVVTRPSVVIRIGTYASSALDQASGSSDNTITIVLAVVIPCVAFVTAILIFASYNFYGNKLSTRYQPVHAVYILRR